MKKIAILNFQHSNNNYGAVLQAAALESHLKGRGFEVMHIDFIPEIKNASLSKYIKYYIRNIFKCFGFIKTIKNEDVVQHCGVFEEFRNVYITRTTKKYKNLKQLRELNNQFDAVVVGSDQVWRTLYTSGHGLVYFLSFVNDKCKKISYAASFGVDFWEEKSQKITKLIKNDIKRFDSISVREDSGVKLCNQVFNVNAQHVLDPTLLIGREFFDTIIDDNIDSNFVPSEIVYYKLDVDKPFLKFISTLGENLNYDVENIYYSKKGIEYQYIPVSEWLFKLRTSKLIVTDSYHCICFAILFEKPFIYIPTKSRGMTRIESLLGLFNLENHICHDYSTLSDIDSVDYTNIQIKLGLLREASIKFLADALK